MMAIDAESLTKDFGRIRAVDNVSFELQPGRVVGFLGPNGSGKTTTLRMLLGLVAPTRGRALIGGRPFMDLADPGQRVGALLGSESPHTPSNTQRQSYLAGSDKRGPRSSTPRLV